MSSATLPFSKMQGTGNDFVVLGPEAAAQRLEWAEMARRLCDRHFGVGADGILLVEPGRGESDFAMRMFNPDGSEAEMCGNGIRCFARYVHDRGISEEQTLRIATGAGIQVVRLVLERGDVAGVEVDMGRPEFVADRIPVVADTREVVDRPLSVDGVTVDVSCVSMGNPHAVAFVDDVLTFPLERVGPLVEHHPWFPRRTNFEIVRVRDRDHLEMRVWERGAGPTLACGTGACGVMAVAARHGFVNDTIDMELPGGHLRLAWDGAGSVMMTGPAEFVFDGLWPLARS